MVDDILACIKPADVVGCVSAAGACALPWIFKSKQEHDLQKGLSFSQSNKYAIVAIFRRLFLSLH